MVRVVKQPEERRKEIISTAMELFAANGYEQTQISDITKKMGVAHGLVYHYFKSKSEIFDAVVNEIVKEYFSGMINILSDSSITAMQRLEALFQFASEYGRSHTGLVEEVHSDANHELHERATKNAVQSLVPIFQKLIEDGNRDGSFRCQHPEETANFILYGTAAVEHHENMEERIEVIRNLWWRCLGIENGKH